jgi:hypothetical protein
LRQYARQKIQKLRNRLAHVAFSRQIAHSDVHSLQIEDKKTTYAGGRGQRSNEARMLERNAGLMPIKLRADALPRFVRAGSIGLLFLKLGGCMTLGDSAPPPVAADSASLPSVNASAPAINISAQAPASSIVQPVKLAPRAKKPQRERRVAAEVPHQRISSIDPDNLIGLAPGAVRKLLGPPARVENDDLSRAWIYASGGCSFRLFFYPNLNTASFRVLKYGGNDGNGELMDVSDVCIRHILMARKDATG